MVHAAPDAPIRLRLRLLLRKIASTSVSPGLSSPPGRRAATDEADRVAASASPSRGYILRTRYREYTDERWLASRAAAGRALCRDNLLRWADRDKDHPPRFPGTRRRLEMGFARSCGVLRDGVVQDDDRLRRGSRRAERGRIRRTVFSSRLYIHALYDPPDAVDVAQLLIAAGNDITFPPQDVALLVPDCPRRPTVISSAAGVRAWTLWRPHRRRRGDAASRRRTRSRTRARDCVRERRNSRALHDRRRRRRRTPCGSRRMRVSSPFESRRHRRDPNKDTASRTLPLRP